jgi:hypothetical protein
MSWNLIDTDLEQGLGIPSDLIFSILIKWSIIVSGVISGCRITETQSASLTVSNWGLWNLSAAR